MDESNKLPFNPALQELTQYLRDFSSNAEIVLWNRIKDKQLGVDFAWQHPIDDFVFTFFCEEKKLAIEIESDAHTHPDAYFSSVQKQEALKEYDIRVIQLREEDIVKAVEKAVEAIEKALDRE